MYHLFFSSLDLIFGCQPWLQGYDRTMKYDLIFSQNSINEIKKSNIRKIKGKVRVVD